MSIEKSQLKGLVKHPSGFYIDVKRFECLPAATPYHKQSPCVGEATLAFSNSKNMWFIGFQQESTDNFLCCILSSQKFVLSVQYSSFYAAGFINSLRPENSSVIPLSVLVSPARLALERYRNQLDRLLK